MAARLSPPLLLETEILSNASLIQKQPPLARHVLCWRAILRSTCQKLVFATTQTIRQKRARIHISEIVFLFQVFF